MLDPYEDVKSEFRRRWRRQLFMIFPLAPFMFASLIWGNQKPEIPAVLGLLAVVPALGFSFWNWRCPSCRCYLGRTMYPKYCKTCGVALR